MRLLSVDDHTHTTNNQPVNLREIGKRVRLRRVDLGLTQAALADKAKVGLGTVQALEDAQNRKHPRQTSPENLEKIAKALDQPLDELIKGKESIAPLDPLLAGLNREDLQVARLYHDSMTAVRQRAQAMLRSGEGDRISAISVRMARLPAQMLTTFEDLLTTSEQSLEANKHVPTEREISEKIKR